jgi:hypothetical protein
MNYPAKEGAKDDVSDPCGKRFMTEPDPIGACPKCKTPIYSREGFAGCVSRGNDKPRSPEAWREENEGSEQVTKDELLKKAEEIVEYLRVHDWRLNDVVGFVADAILSVQSAQREEDASTIEHACHCPHCEEIASEIRAQGEK